MTLGEQYIKDNGIEELGYEEAIETSKRELLGLGIDYYNDDEIADNPVYPCNAELYDEFVESCGFDSVEYCAFIRRRIELD